MEISEAIRLSLQDLDFGVETFGDAIVASVSPHARDLVGPGGEGISQGAKRGEGRELQFSDGAEQSRGQAAALSGGAMFVQQQMAKPLFVLVDDLQSREAIEVVVELGALLVGEVLGVATHERNQTAMFGTGGNELFPGGQEVMAEQAHDVKAVRDNHGVGEMLLHQAAVAGGQVHTDELDVLLAGK